MGYDIFVFVQTGRRGNGRKKAAGRKANADHEEPPPPQPSLALSMLSLMIVSLYILMVLSVSKRCLSVTESSCMHEGAERVGEILESEIYVTTLHGESEG